MKYLTALSIAFMICFAAQSSQAKDNRAAHGEKYIKALIAAPSLAVYSDDGAADVTVVTDNPVPAVRAIVELGAKAIPLLIAHLDDTRLTSARFSRNNAHVPVGHVCLDILTAIIKAPRMLVEDCADDGLGACVRRGYYFRPDAYSQRGRRLLARPEVSRAKANWLRAYRKGYVKYHNPA